MKQRISFFTLVVLLAMGATAAQRSASPQQHAAAQAKPSSPPATETHGTHDDEKNTVGEISEDVAQVRFQKLGYRDFGSWTRNGDHLENTATKDGKSWKLRIHVTTGAMEETVVSARR